MQLSEADAADVSERLEDFLSFCAPPDSNDEFKVGVVVGMVGCVRRVSGLG
jgi:hypothetical protein